MIRPVLLLLLFPREHVWAFRCEIGPSRTLATSHHSSSTTVKVHRPPRIRKERHHLLNPPLCPSSYVTRTTSTALHVSELHVPGYTQTKLPFILSREEAKRSDERDTKSRSECSYESSIPYEGGFLLHKTSGPVLTPHECQLVVNEAEGVASTVMDWTRNRHGNYPTTDLPIAELPRTLEMFKRALVQRIYPLLRAQFAPYLPDPSKLRVADGFVVKYDAVGGQTSLKPHRDGSVLSFNIALNPSNEYEGGGTWFASLDSATRIEEGEICSHASALLHGGHPISSGKRYILVAFVILEGFDNWSMRFYNQVRNM